MGVIRPLKNRLLEGTDNNKNIMHINKDLVCVFMLMLLVHSLPKRILPPIAWSLDGEGKIFESGVWSCNNP